MKKFISLCLAVVLVCSISITAFAESYGTTNNTVPYYRYATTTVEGQVYSSCTVSIPETVYANEFSSGDITITNADVESGHEIVISVINLSEDNTLILNNTNNDKTVGCTITIGEGVNSTNITRDENTIARIKDTQIPDDKTAYVGFKALITDTSRATAGIYSGTMEFEVRIDPYQ